jgi:hypothetical protein
LAERAVEVTVDELVDEVESRVLEQGALSKDQILAAWQLDEEL